MRQYCSVCKSHYEMDVVRESAEDGVVWLRCPNCKGILPHMPEVEVDGVESSAASGEADRTVEDVADAVTEVAVDPLADMDVESARAYAPQETYEVGDVVHHRGWNDFGVVLAKETLPGNRHMIRVRFSESGEVQLIEGASA